MNMKLAKKFLSVILCIVLVAALAFNTVGCAKEEPQQEAPAQKEILQDVSMDGYMIEQVQFVQIQEV